MAEATPGDDLDVGVVVVTHNSAAVVGMVLSTLATGFGDLHWRVVFVDNASSDGTVDMITTAGFDVLTLDQNRGYAAAINRGTEQLATARTILVLNPDVELTPGCVDAMARVLADDHVGVVAPKMCVPRARSTLQQSLRRSPSIPRTWGAALLGARLSRRFAALSVTVADPRCYEVDHDVDWATGAALLSSRRCIEAVGGWDESFFLYCEEIDYCRRVREAGFAVRFAPDAVVLHQGGEGGVLNPRLRAMMVVNNVREYRRRSGRLASWCFYAGTLLHEAIRSLAGRSASRAAAVALISPRRRPAEIDASNTLLPR